MAFKRREREAGMDCGGGGYQHNRRGEETDRLAEARDECNAMSYSYAAHTDEGRGEGKRRGSDKMGRLESRLGWPNINLHQSLITLEKM